MGCNIAVLPEPPIKNRRVNCFIFEKRTSKPHNDNLCSLSPVALFLHVNDKREEEKSELIVAHLQNMEDVDADEWQSVFKYDIQTLDDLTEISIFLYDIGIVDVALVGELATRSIEKSFTTVRLLRYNNQFCYVSIINALLKTYRCPTRKQFNNRTGKPKIHLATCHERVRHNFPKN